MTGRQPARRPPEARRSAGQWVLDLIVFAIVLGTSALAGAGF